MADFEKRVNIEVQLEADVAGAVGKLATALGNMRTAAENMEGDLNKAEKAIDDFDPGEDADIEIGGEVDTTSIRTAVTNARLQANHMANDIGGPKIPVGAKIDEFDIPEEIGQEITELSELREAAEKADSAKESVSAANRKLSDSADNTSSNIDMETRSVRQLFDELDGDGLEEAKHAVSNANSRLSGSADETAHYLRRESDASDNAVNSILGLNRAKDETTDTSHNLRRALRRTRGATDEMGDSMRAANEVGELFEDGMGNLSVNVGAFTIALRNFLTQVPLMITGLGAMGAAAAGAATAFVALAGAMGLAIGAGVVAHAQQIAESNKDIEETAEALSNIMQNLGDTFAEAFSPLLENSQTIQVFIRAVEGIAGVAQQAAESINRLMDASGELSDGVLSVQGVMGQLRQQVGDDLHRVMLELEEAFKDLQGEFIWGMEVMVAGTADLIDRSRELFMQIEDLGGVIGNASEMLSEMAEVGMNIGGGLVPIFTAVENIFTGVAQALNAINDETLENAVTFLAIIAVVNRFGAVLGSVLTLLPNLIVGMSLIAGAATSADTTFGSLNEALRQTSVLFGGFLRHTSGLFGGLTALVEAAEEFDERMRMVMLSTNTVNDQLRDMAESSLIASEGIEATEDNVEELTDQLQRLVIQSKVTDAQLKELGVENTIDKKDLQMSSLTDDAAMGGAAATGGSTGIVPKGVVDRLKGMRKSLAATAAAGSTYSATTIFATAATWLLNAAITVLTGGLFTAIAAVAALIGVIGGLAVGVITNMESIKSAASTTFGLISTAVSEIVDLLVTYFVAAWNLMVDLFLAVWTAVKPIVEVFILLGSALGLLGKEGESAGGAMSMLSGIIGVTKAAINILAAALGGLFKLLGSSINIILQVLLFPLKALIIVLGAVIDLIMGALNAAFEAFMGWIGMSGEGIGGLIEMINDWIDTLFEWGNQVLMFFEDVVNGIIGLFNSFIKTLNKVPFVDLPTFDDVSLTSKAKAEREDLMNDETADEEQEGKVPPVVEYREDNSTNIDQQVDADPEDQAQLSRVVTDAIEEANSFARRQQGGQ